MASSSSHRSSRGRSHARGGGKILPPIPERSLSSQKLGRTSSSGSGGTGGNVGVSGGGPTPESMTMANVKGKGKHHGHGHGGSHRHRSNRDKRSVRPSPESRSPRTTTVTAAIPAVESRDDDNDNNDDTEEAVVAIVPPAPAAVVATDVNVKIIKPMEEILVQPSPPHHQLPPPGASSVSVVSMSSARSKESSSRHYEYEPRASVKEAEVASVAVAASIASANSFKPQARASQEPEIASVASSKASRTSKREGLVASSMISIASNREAKLSLAGASSDPPLVGEDAKSISDASVTSEARSHRSNLSHRSAQSQGSRFTRNSMIAEQISPSAPLFAAKILSLAGASDPPTVAEDAISISDASVISEARSKVSARSHRSRSTRNSMIAEQVSASAPFDAKILSLAGASDPPTVAEDAISISDASVISEARSHKSNQSYRSRSTRNSMIAGQVSASAPLFDVEILSLAGASDPPTVAEDAISISDASVISEARSHKTNQSHRSRSTRNSMIAGQVSASAQSGAMISMNEATKTNKENGILPPSTSSRSIANNPTSPRSVTSNLSRTRRTSNAISQAVEPSVNIITVPEERISNDISTRKYKPEPSWEDYQQARSLATEGRIAQQTTKTNPRVHAPAKISSQEFRKQATTSGATRSETADSSSNDQPEIPSIPDDEIMDSFMKNPSGAKPNAYSDDDDASHLSDEMEMVRETRDNYQLGRLQTRINRRRELGNGGQRVKYGEEDSTNYKTLRYSRIKTVRNLYSTHHRRDEGSNCDSQLEHHHPDNDSNSVGIKSSIGEEYQVPLSPGGSQKSVGASKKTMRESFDSSIHASPSIHGSITNNTSSTIPSLKGGQSVISHSLTSSVSGVEIAGGTAQCTSQNSVASVAMQSVAQSSPSKNINNIGDDSTAELSEFRGKLFAKMMILLNDLSPTKQSSLSGDDVSHIKDMVIDEGRASCCSIAELKLIQKLTEEEMSRILNEFEQNNSLVEKRERVYKGIPDFQTGNGNIPTANTNHGNFVRMNHVNIHNVGEEDSSLKESCPPPENVTYHSDDPHGIIFSKFSDVTSPTCHDGFELDEIGPGRHVSLPPLLKGGTNQSHHSPLQGSPRNGSHRRRRLPPSSSSSLPFLPSTLSPAAVAAASVAASMSISASGKAPEHQLPCVLEITDAIKLNEDDNSKGKHASPKQDEAEVCASKEDLVVSQEVAGKDTTEDIVDGMNPLETTESSKFAINAGPLLTEDKMANGDLLGDEEDAEMKLKAEKLEAARRMKEEAENKRNEEAERKLKKEEAEEKQKAADFLAASRERAQHMVKEERFHDDIFAAAAKAVDCSSKERDDAELDEVTSILSMYEEAEKMAKGMEDAMARRNAAKEEDEASLLVTDNFLVGADFVSVQRYEEEAGPNVVTFLNSLEPSSLPKQVEDEAMCGCVIQ